MCVKRVESDQSHVGQQCFKVILYHRGAAIFGALIKH